MTNHRHLLRACFPCLLLAVAPLLAHCGEAAGFGTETGNPPRLEEKQLHLELVEGGIRVVGAAGAVAPPRASVRVTNLTTGASVQAAAGTDGSLDVVIAGDVGDELEVAVTSGGRETSERISFAETAARTDWTGVSCEALEAIRAETLVAAFANADLACDFNFDCISVAIDSASACGGASCLDAIASRAGAAAATAQGQQQTAALCNALEACDIPPPTCPDVEPGFRIAECQAGTCVRVAPVRVTCDDMLGPAAPLHAQLLAEADRQCSEDADCGLASIEASCIARCPPALEAIAVAAVSGLEANIRDQVESVYCVPALAYGCEGPVLDCNAPPAGTPRAVCVSRSCALLYE